MKIIRPTSSVTQRIIVPIVGFFLLLLITALSGAALITLISGPALARADAQTSSPGQAILAKNQAKNPAQPTTPLEKLLNNDGTLNLNTGFTGSLDPTGWQLATAQNQRPRFVRASTSRKQLNHALERSEGSKLKTTPSNVVKGQNSYAPRDPGDENWDDRFYSSGLDGPVYAVAISGSSVYVGGRFTSVNRLTVNGIARWDSSSSQWSALGTGVSGASADVTSIAINGGDVYVGGFFTTAGGVSANNVARWDGSQWRSLGSGPDNGVDDLVLAVAVSGANVYVGGYFTTAGTVSANHIARWDGSQWSALGNGIGTDQFESVNAIAISGSNVYAGGNFTTAGGVSANNVARWDSAGSQWSALGGGANNGVDGPIYTIAINGANLYAGGSFTTAGAANVNNIARWDSASNQWFSYLGSGVGVGGNDYVGSIVINGSDTYIGGLFATAGGVNANNIVRCDASGCHAMSTGVDGNVDAIGVGGTNVYIGGYFTTAGGVRASNIAHWDTAGSQWYSLGSGANNGLDGPVYGIGFVGSNVYLGGSFSEAGGVNANNVVRWDGTQWYPLGSGASNGANGFVGAVAISGTNVYVGGVFTATAGIPANNVARWDSASNQWYPLGSGVTFDQYGGVSAIAITGTNVYVGGYFTTAGGVAANNVARWNSASNQWSALGSGVGGANDSVYAIGIGGSNVYVGGSFTTAGGIPTNNIASWDSIGNQWRTLGSGVGSSIDDSVYAIGIGGSNVYAGGFFTTAGGVSANSIARWDGTQWYPLGSGASNGVTGGVLAMTVSGNYLYAGGFFPSAGGISANNIARWDGTQWRSMGSGVNNGVYAIGVNGLDVHIGGDFVVAGNKPSVHFGIWHDPGLVSHITWQGRPNPPDARLQLPVTLTLKLGTAEINFPSQSTSASAYLTTAVGTLPAGTYNWRAKNPKYLATSGTVTLTGAGVTNLEMGQMRAGDADNNNLINTVDFNIMKVTYGKGIGEPNYDDRADFNGDTLVNASDFLLVKINFGQGGAPPISPGK